MFCALQKFPAQGLGSEAWKSLFDSHGDVQRFSKVDSIAGHMIYGLCAVRAARSRSFSAPGFEYELSSHRDQLTRVLPPCQLDSAVVKGTKENRGATSD